MNISQCPFSDLFLIMRQATSRPWFMIINTSLLLLKSFRLLKVCFFHKVVGAIDQMDVDEPTNPEKSPVPESKNIVLDQRPHLDYCYVHYYVKF